MSGRPRSSAFWASLTILLAVVAIGELVALILNYQNNAYLQKWVAENGASVYAGVSAVLALGLGAGYLAYRRSKMLPPAGPSPISRSVSSLEVRRILAIARKSLAQFRHDKRTLAFVLVMPLFMVLAFGYTFGGQVHNVRTLVVNQDAGPFAARIVANITGDTLQLVSSPDPSSAQGEVRIGHAWAALVFLPGFSVDLFYRNATVQVMLDGSSPTIVSAVLGGLRAAIERAFTGIVGVSPLTLDQEYIYGSANTRFIDSFAPGVIALAVLMVTTIFSVIIIVRERTGGVLERLFSTPLQSHELVVGHALALAVVALMQSAVVLGAALLIFQVQVVGSIPLAFGVLLLFAAGNQGLGMMLSGGAQNELQAVQFIPLIIFPSLLLTGVFYPLEAIPDGLRGLSFFVPLTYANDALHSIMLRGWGIADVSLDLVALLVYDILTLAGAAILIRRQA